MKSLYFLVDVNDCSNPARAPCGSGQRCENYPGTYRCYCNSPGQIISESGLCSGEKKCLRNTKCSKSLNFSAW